MSAATTCNGCGVCCDPVMLPTPYLSFIADPAIPAAERRWARDHLTPMPAKEALAKAPHYRGEALFDKNGRYAQPFFFRCDLLDPDTRQCRDYDNRPAVCRGFPWYEFGPNEAAALPAECEFNLDVGRPVVLTTKAGR